jgi:hypothetical protein
MTVDDPASKVLDHGYVDGRPPPGPCGDVDSFPSDAEYARTLLAFERRAALATLNLDGFPYCSIASYVIDGDGFPMTCISSLAEHTLNVRRDPRASVVVSEPVDRDRDPLSAARVTLVGTMVEFEASAEIRDAYIDRHPTAAHYVHYEDFSWWRLQPHIVRYVGGFGHMSWVDVDALRTARADPIRDVARDICAHMNDDHADANLAYARALCGVDDATAAEMVAVDRYGFTLAVHTPAGVRTGRVRFPGEVATAGQVRAAVISMLADAREPHMER